MSHQVATRLAYGTALVKIGKNNSRVIAMDGDTKNSTFAIKFKVGVVGNTSDCGNIAANLWEVDSRIPDT